ncbi:hypothetical protein GQ602_006272 [Ophiocordyceps camponoti-floridani]|uniref:Uncharacterized protein n=1 Tax=Ophiocordyceps camponoti-floridani TaxID=2030778 RepID=A0A8H4Q2Z7_9HYPO|nr:hypothetical protein GQ602_006272 [Ophiocordyceps camponoti-floridani]
MGLLSFLSKRSQGDEGRTGLGRQRDCRSTVALTPALGGMNDSRRPVTHDGRRESRVVKPYFLGIREDGESAPIGNGNRWRRRERERVEKSGLPRHVDLLDAQGEFRPCDFRSRVRAAGTRDYGEDVAERNMVGVLERDAVPKRDAVPERDSNPRRGPSPRGVMVPERETGPDRDTVPPRRTIPVQTKAIRLNGGVVAITAFAEPSSPPVNGHGPRSDGDLSASPPSVPRYRPHSSIPDSPPQQQTARRRRPLSETLADDWAAGRLRPMQSMEADGLQGRNPGMKRRGRRLRRGDSDETSSSSDDDFTFDRLAPLSAVISASFPRRPVSLAHAPPPVSLTPRRREKPRSRSRTCGHSLAVEFAGHVPERSSSLNQWSLTSSMNNTPVTELSDHSTRTSTASKQQKRLDSSSSSFVSSSAASTYTSSSDADPLRLDGESLLFKPEGYGTANLPGLIAVREKTDRRRAARVDADDSPEEKLPARRNGRGRRASRRVRGGSRIEPVLEDWEEGHAADVE